MRYVYISGPIQGCGGIPRELNCRSAIVVAGHLLASGLVPFVPHTSILWNMIDPRTEAEWIRWCVAWIERCDCLLRLPGVSRGSDLEVARAEELGLPVFRCVEALLEAAGKEPWQ